MPADHPDPPLRMPTDWHDHVWSTMLNAFCLARLACGVARGWAAKPISTRVGLKAELGRCYCLLRAPAAIAYHFCMTGANQAGPTTDNPNRTRFDRQRIDAPAQPARSIP